MTKLLIASGNTHKIKEIETVLKSIQNINILSLKDFGITIDVIEDAGTLEGNALKKAREFYNVFKIPTISDDTGLFVDPLDGDPGVYSARYAGEDASYSDNCNKLLTNLKDIPLVERTARFESVICYYVNSEENYLFKGVCEGKIINEPHGNNGFGYDPLFVPDDYNLTFAELTDKEKNKISHRGRALEQFKDFLVTGKK